MIDSTDAATVATPPKATVFSTFILMVQFLSLFEINSAIVAFLFSKFSLDVGLCRKIFHELMAISFFIYFHNFSKYEYDLPHAILSGILGALVNIFVNLILLSSNHFKHLINESTMVYLAHYLLKHNDKHHYKTTEINSEQTLSSNSSNNSNNSNNSNGSNSSKTSKNGTIPLIPKVETLFETILSYLNINNFYSETFLSAKVHSRMRKVGDYRGFVRGNVLPHLGICVVAGCGAAIVSYLGGVYCRKLSIMFSVALFGDGWGMLVPRFLRYLSGDKWIFHRIDCIVCKGLDCKKTLEGSLGVFLSTFVFLLVIVDKSDYSSAMCAMIAGGYACVEAFAPKDFDNPLLFLYVMVVFSLF